MDKKEMKPVDFYILQEPYAIQLECPHCGLESKIDWKELDVPEYWGDSWGWIKCPECGEKILLGEYDIG